MSVTSDQRSEEFLKISGQFKLGALVTESSHPVTANLSDVAKKDIAAALGLLFEADGDVIKKFREFTASRKAEEIKDTILRSLKNGGRIFFTGCGSTGRLSILLDSVWRDFWQQQVARGTSVASDFENRSFSVMAGGDYALIKSVEGFEDITTFGKKQINDLNISSKDIVFAITEGGETSFVIGTAWAGVEAGAKVYFVYNNPNDILCEHVQRSREVIQDSRIEKINLTTGPMSITGSTRMQATSIQLCIMLTILEMVARELMQEKAGDPSPPSQFLAGLEELHANLKSPEVLASLADLVALEESAYRTRHKNNYFANRFGIDVLTDTTERSPTYCTPPFRKFDDTTASESWAFLFLPQSETPSAWENILKRPPRCVEWNENEVRNLVGDEKPPRTMETIRKIIYAELMRFKIGLDGLPCRVLNKDDCAVAVVSEAEKYSLLSSDGFFPTQLSAAKKAGAKTSLIYFGQSALSKNLADKTVFIPLPKTDFLLDGIARVAVKLVMNALSTCTMVRLGRVMGNTMIWVVPSNLKLIDRATRYISRLASLDYTRANQLLFEVIEYVEPRMKSDRAYPPVVGLAVLRAKENLTNEQAESRLNSLLQPPHVFWGIKDTGRMISIDHLTKRFGTQTAVDSLSLEIPAGQIVGFLGPNGAGKSTTLRMLTGMIEPTSGTATICGFDLRRDPMEVKRHVGFVPESGAVFESLTGLEYLEMVAALYGIPGDAARKRIEQFIAFFDLSFETLTDKLLGAYSKGMRRKVVITSALLHNPPVVFFDEPLDGLDANAAVGFKALIQTLAREGKTIVYSSHILDVVERVCHRVIIIDKGKLLVDGKPDELVATHNSGTLEKLFTQLTGGTELEQRAEDFAKTFRP